MKELKYINVTASNLEKLTLIVNRKIHEGYEPIGGMTPAAGGYAQTMLKPNTSMEIKTHPLTQ